MKGEKEKKNGRTRKQKQKASKQTGRQKEKNAMD